MTLQTHLQAGLTFLQTSQLENGNWLIEVTERPEMQQRELRDNVFSAAVIVREIGPMSTGLPMVARACNFLRDQQRSNGLWNFYKKRDMRLLPSDFDTTACVGAALLLANHPFDVQPILSQLQQYQHPEGGYWTLAMPPVRVGINPIVNNFRDHIIQTHILMFLILVNADSSETLLRYLVDVLRSRDYVNPQPSYDAPLLFLTMFARAVAYMDQPPCDLQAEIAEHLLQQAARPVLNSLELAYAIRGLLACEYPGDLDPWIQRLVEQQRDDGGWPDDYFYKSELHYYGARPITTAMALHAIASYAGRLQT